MRLPSATRAACAILATAALAGCVSNETVQSHPVTDNAGGTVATAHRRAQVHTALAGEYFSRGNFTVALAETKSAVEDDPNYAPAYNIQGLIYMELREDVSARAAFDHALSISPNDPEILNNFGWYLCTRGDSDRAVGMLRRAAGDPLYPTPEKAFLSLGLCYRRMHKDDEARRFLQRAVQLQPNLIGGLYNLAVIDYEDKVYKDADIYLTRYMRLVAVPPLEGLVLGVRIARANHDSEGEESYLQQLRRRYPDSPQLRELESRR